MAGYPVRAAMFGVGSWARVLAKAAKQSAKIELVGCVGRNPERTATYSLETGIPAGESPESVLQDPGIDAVLLALPNDLHWQFAQQAARQGKHVFIEKPIASTLEDGLRIAELERTAGVRIVVGHCARLLAGNRMIREMIDAGKLGQVTQVEANFSTGTALRLSPKDWRWYQKGAPGGPLSQVAIHQFDTLRFLGGDIAAVSARAARHSPVGAEVEDQWVVTVEFTDGKLGCVICSWTSPGTYNVRVTGSQALVFYEIDQTYWALPDRLHENAIFYRQERGAGIGARQKEQVSPGNMFREELDLFADSIQHPGECELSAENACQALAAVYGALQSADRGGAAVRLAEVVSEAKANVNSKAGERAGT